MPKCGFLVEKKEGDPVFFCRQFGTVLVGRLKLHIARLWAK